MKIFLVYCSLAFFLIAHAFAMTEDGDDCHLEESIQSMYHFFGVKGKLEFSELPLSFGDRASAFRISFPSRQEYGVIQEAACAGNAYAQWVVGKLHEILLIRDAGGEDPRKTAITWYRLAATQKFHEAEYDLGKILSMGRGIAVDRQESQRLITLAAEGGEPRAQNRFALYYIEELQEKLIWLRRSADQEYGTAFYNIGCLLEPNGIMGPSSYYYRQALQIFSTWGRKNCGHICEEEHEEGLRGFWNRLGHHIIYEHEGDVCEEIRRHKLPPTCIIL